MVGLSVYPAAQVGLIRLGVGSSRATRSETCWPQKAAVRILLRQLRLRRPGVRHSAWMRMIRLCHSPFRVPSGPGSRRSNELLCKELHQCRRSSARRVLRQAPCAKGNLENQLNDSTSGLALRELANVPVMLKKDHMWGAPQPNKKWIKSLTELPKDY